MRTPYASPISAGRREVGSRRVPRRCALLLGVWLLAGAGLAPVFAAPPARAEGEHALQQCFAKFDSALVSDRGKIPGFTDVVASVRAVLPGLRDPALRLQAQYLLALSQFLAGDADGAASSVARLRVLAAKAGKPIPAAALAKLGQTGKVPPQEVVKTLCAGLALNADARALASDLVRLQEARQRVGRRLAARKAAARQTVNRQIVAWCSREGLPEADFTIVRQRLDRLFDRQGHLTADDIRNAILRRSLEILTQ